MAELERFGRVSRQSMWHTRTRCCLVISGFTGIQGSDGPPDGRCWTKRGYTTRCIAGGGDHVMAHAFCGDWESPCLTRMMGRDSRWYGNAVAWASKVYPLVKARVGVVNGAALHLWHGDLASRQPMLRYEALRNAQFDPDLDLEPDESGCWRWATHKPSLHAALENYLADRRSEAVDRGSDCAYLKRVPGITWACRGRSRACLIIWKPSPID